MKSPKLTTSHTPEPVPQSGGSWIHDEATGSLSRALPPVEAPVQDPVQPASKEA